MKGDNPETRACSLMNNGKVLLALYTLNPKHFLEMMEWEDSRAKIILKVLIWSTEWKSTLHAQHCKHAASFPTEGFYGCLSNEDILCLRALIREKPNQDLGEKVITEITKQFMYTQNNCSIMTSAIPCTSLVCAWAEAPACRNPRAGYRNRGLESG